MSRLSPLLKRTGWWLIAGFSLAIFLMVATSCATPGELNIGNFKENSEITQSFQSYQYFPGYTYYFAGSMNEPQAVVGILPDYRIQVNSGWGSHSTRWQQLETTTENLKSLVEGINSKKRADRKPYGVLLSDPAGKQVGILYVTINRNYQPRIRVFEDNRINVVARVYVGPPISTR